MRNSKTNLRAVAFIFWLAAAAGLSLPSEAAAVLSLGTPTTSASGLSILVPINGIASLPLLPANGATNWIVFVNGVYDPLLRTSVSGASETLTLQQGVAPGQSVVLSYVPGNVSDSASPHNTMSPQPNVSVLNASTALSVGPGSAAGAAVSTSGGFVDQSTPAGSSSTAVRNLNVGTELATTVFGSSASLEYSAATASSVSVVVDGVAATFPLTVGGTWQTLPLFSYSADATHTVVVKAAATLYVDKYNALRVTAAGTPAATLTVPGQTVQFRTGISSSYPAYVDVSPFGWSNNTDSSNYDVDPSSQDASIRWCGTGAAGSTISVYAFGAGGYVRLGVGAATPPAQGAATSTAPGAQMSEQPTVTLANDGKWAWRVVGVCPDAAEHTFTLSAGKGSGFLLNMLRMDGGTIDTTPLTPRPLWAFVGDSITNGGPGTSVNTTPAGDTSQSWAHLVGEASNYAVANFGVSGSGFSSGTTGPLLGRLPLVIAARPSRLSLLIGTNDLAVSGCSAFTFTAAYAQALNVLTTSLPNATIDCLGIFNRPTSDRLNPTIANWNAALQAMVSGYGNANVRFVDSTGMNAGDTAWYDADGSQPLHPDGPHCGVIAGDYLAQAFAPAAPAVTLGAQGMSVPLTWTAASGAAGYRVYRDGGGVPVYDGPGLSYTDATTNGTHTYVVTSYNAAGDVGSSQQAITSLAGG